MRNAWSLAVLALLLLPAMACGQKTSGKVGGGGHNGWKTGAPAVNLSSTTLSFGSVTVGQTSAAQVVTLTNTGTLSLAITSIVTTSPFANTTTCTGTLAAGSSCTISITFSPVSAVASTGTTTLTDNAKGTTQVISLSGLGGAASAPIVQLSPTSLTFSGQQQNTTSQPQTVTMTNTGSASLTITSIVTTGAFADTTTCGGTLAAGASCNISVTFTPTSVAAFTGSVTITDNAADSPEAVSLSGTGVSAPSNPVVNLSASSLAFGTIGLGISSPSQVITLTNTGTAGLSISSIVTTGDFSDTTTCGSTLAAGSNCTVTVTFTPTASGARTGTTTFTDSASNSPQTVSLSGTGALTDHGATLPTACTSGVLAYPCAAPTFPDTTGYVTKTVCASTCDYTTIQAAVNAVHTDGGDTNGEIIKLASNATFSESVTLAVYTMTAGKWVIITTNTAAANLPSAGVRMVGATYTSVMAHVVSPGSNQPVFLTTGTANFYWFWGIEVTANTDTVNLIQIGNNETTTGALPNNLVFDRVYVHGNNTNQIRRGVLGNGSIITVMNSDLENFHDTATDSQAILAYNGTTYYIGNNLLEAASENIMFGCCDPTITNLVPSDITFVQNWVKKPTSYATDYKGQLKDLFEIKNGQRYLVEGNVFDTNYADAQSGYAFQLTPRNAGKACTWCANANGVFRYNQILNTSAGWNITGADTEWGTTPTSQPSLNIAVHDNVGINWSSTWNTGVAGDTNLLQVANGSGVSAAHNIWFDHNTVFQVGSIVFATTTGTVTDQFTFEDSIQPHNTYGVVGTSSCCASTTLNTYFTNYLFTKNVLENIAPSSLTCANYAPGTNYCPPDWTTVQFVNYSLCNSATPTLSDCALLSTSPYHNLGTDGADLGANISTVISKTSGVN